MTAARGSEASGAGINLRVIGRIRAPFVEASGTPIQSAYAEGSEKSVIVDDALSDALDDVEGFERVWLAYWMDRVSSCKPDVSELDAHPSARAGWLEKCGVDRRVTDGRFHAAEGSKRGGHR